MIVYRGVRNPDGLRVVTVEGGGQPPRLLAPRTDVRNHGRDFDWGCGSDGAAQLALALACDALKDNRRAALVHQALKWELVKGFDRDSWEINQNVLLSVIEYLETSPLRQGNGHTGDEPSPLGAAAPF